MRRKKPSKPTGLSEDTQTPYAAPPRQKVEIGEGGRLVIPAPMREALGIKPGDKVIVEQHDTELRIYSFREAGRRVQAIARKYIPEGVSLSDEVIEERRRRAAGEIDD
jgi:AbrB family looped-hinge helix DNA binding protein